MWICRLYKQSGSLRLATVISKVADGSELRGPFLQHNRAWMHCHPGTFLLSLHSRTCEIHPDHQSESSWVGKQNGYPCVLFPRESAFCQMLRGCVSKVFNRFAFLLPGVPFCTAERTGETFESGLNRVALGTHAARSHWVQNWLKPDLLIFAAHECVCMCVCSCTCARMCVHVGVTCSVACRESLLLLHAHIYALISSEITFSYFQSRGGDVTLITVLYLPAFLAWFMGGHRALSRPQRILALLMELLNKSHVHCFWGCWSSTI